MLSSSLVRKSGKEQVMYLSSTSHEHWKILFMYIDMSPGACSRPSGISRQDVNRECAHGRGVCPIGSGEHPAGKGPRTILRPLGEDDRGGEE
jgi:hypothetical protein